MTIEKPEIGKVIIIIKIVFLDVDGTLYNDLHKLSANNRAICNQLEKAKIPVIINTGRMSKNAIKIGYDLAADPKQGYIVANNGAEVYSLAQKKIIFQKIINYDRIVELYQWVEAHHFKIQIYTPDSMYVNKAGVNSSYWADVMDVDYKVLQNKSDLGRDKKYIRAIVIVSEDYNLKQIKAVAQQLQEHLPDLDIHHAWDRVIEVITPGIHKGFGVRFVCDQYQISPNDALAMGDGFNDFELLKSVGYPIAMNNAIPELKDIAKAIARNNNEDGVAGALEKYVLNQQPPKKQISNKGPKSGSALNPNQK